MAWNDGGGDSGNRDPWGNRGDQGPPDLDEAIRKLQNQLSGIFGGGRGGSSSEGGGGLEGQAGFGPQLDELHRRDLDALRRGVGLGQLAKGRDLDIPESRGVDVADAVEMRDRNRGRCFLACDRREGAHQMGDGRTPGGLQVDRVRRQIRGGRRPEAQA